MEVSLSTENNSKSNLVSNGKPKNFGKIFVTIALIAIFNDAGYNLITSSAQALAKQFDEKEFISFFSLILAVCNVIVNFVNSKYLLRVNHFTKIKITILLSIIAYLTISGSILLNTKTGFYLSILGTIFMGTSFTLGILTLLGYLKAFNPIFMGAWGIGTGTAGILSTFLNFILRVFNIPGYIIFFVMIPTALIYFGLFAWLEAQRLNKNSQGTLAGRTTATSIALKNEELGVNQNGEDFEESLRNQDSKTNKTLNLDNLRLAWPKISFLALNLGLVFCFEYIITTALFDGATRKFANSSSSIEKNAFVLLSLCYGIGVVIARGSLSFIKIQKVEFLTIIQIINTAAWIYIALRSPLSLYAMIPLSIWVGLQGGGVYVNSMFMIMKDDKIPKDEKEICVNLMILLNFFGIILGSLVAFLFEKVILPQ